MSLKSIIYDIFCTDRSREYSVRSLPGEDSPILGAFISEQKRRDEEYELKHRRYMEGSDALERNARDELFPNLAPAGRRDYLAWLKGYVNAGNSPTHYYEYPFERWNNFYIAKKDIHLVRLCGASAINIIVPNGINVLGGDRGHCNVFYYDGYEYRGIVPVFSDTVF